MEPTTSGIDIPVKVSDYRLQPVVVLETLNLSRLITQFVG